MKEYLAYLCDHISLDLLTGEIKDKDGDHDAYDEYFDDFHFHYPITWRNGSIYVGEKRAIFTKPFSDLTTLSTVDTFARLHEHIPIRPTADGEWLTVQIHGKDHKAKLYTINGKSFIGVEESRNSLAWMEYGITRSFIDDFFREETSGEWPSVTLDKQTKFIDYINTNFIRRKINVSVSDDGLHCGEILYKIVELKNGKYILRGNIEDIIKALKYTNISVFRNELKSGGHGVFPEFDTKEELVQALKRIIR